MIELQDDALTFSFPDVHPEARLSIDLQRTLRIPDDGNDYPLPPGLGRFPIRLVDDFSKEVPRTWFQHGGVMLPMYQSEALWLNFQCGWVEKNNTQYPFAIKIAAGKINAVSGDAWTDGLQSRSQDYMVAPEQPWLDGFCVEKGYIRQFVAMPLGSGYSAEEQLTGKAEFGGLQVIVYPMKRDVFDRRFPERMGGIRDASALYGLMDSAICSSAADMALAPGGRMRQEIYEDPFSFDDWDREHTSRCFVHLANSMVWRSITGSDPPSVPPTAKEYKKAGLPWFDYYDDNAVALGGSKKLDGLDSVAETGQKKGDVPLPENESITPEHIIDLRRGLKAGQVREGRF